MLLTSFLFEGSMCSELMRGIAGLAILNGREHIHASLQCGAP